jgi:endogenous inhibitor of DNA gyrase (YacG/DUF329 family)
MTTKMSLLCPTCKGTIEWSDKYPYRPFCSHRCQQIDFGDWANEQFRVAGETNVNNNREEES